MPTKSEQVLNRGLNAHELSEIIRKDVDALLARDGMLSSSVVAFGRCAYEVRIVIHTGNPFYPDHRLGVASRWASEQEAAEKPSLKAIEPLPLELKPVVCEICGQDQEAHPDNAYVDPRDPGLYHDWQPAPADVVHAVERSRQIPSPNLARIQNQMPITVETRGLDGRVEQKEVVYPKEVADKEGPQPVDREVTAEAQAEIEAKRKK